jgi:hypothetical protein
MSGLNNDQLRIQIRIYENVDLERNMRDCRFGTETKVDT